VDGDHNLIWVPTNTATLRYSAGQSRANPVDTTFSVQQS
jgi:hypothetical protein